MEQVALRLQTEANGRGDFDEKDIFGRSAYNRYYYSVFLIVRLGISQFDQKWGSLPHKDYPELILGSISKTIKGERKRAIKLADSDLISIYSEALSAANELSTLMKRGYATRIVADYQPETKITVEGSQRFSLAGVNITEAHNWPSKARLLLKTIDRAWVQAHAA